MSWGYVPIVLMYMAKENVPIGHDIFSMAMYEKANADLFIKLTKYRKKWAFKKTFGVESGLLKLRCRL